MNKTLHFCTLFDSNYLTRGLALYLSLADTCPDFVLYVIAFDDKCHEILTKLKLEKMVVISLKEFEDPELLRIKPTRTRQEYCWTCSSSSILYCIKKYNLEMCTYIDADLLFYDNPKILIDEMKDDSIFLTEHRMPEEGKKIELAGIYCVQFMPFKNNTDGMTALTWWRDRCIEWCSAIIEDGKLGDQKYLDDWTVRFKGVHVMQHAGGGVAPWNLYRYKMTLEGKKLFVAEKSSKSPLVFYHFQSTLLYRLLGTIRAYYSTYYWDESAIKYMYSQYADKIHNALMLIQTVEPDFNLGFDKPVEFFPFITKRFIQNITNRTKKIVKSVLFQ